MARNNKSRTAILFYFFFPLRERECVCEEISFFAPVFKTLKWTLSNKQSVNQTPKAIHFIRTIYTQKGRVKGRVLALLELGCKELGFLDLSRSLSVSSLFKNAIMHLAPS